MWFYLFGRIIQLDVARFWNRRKPRKLEPCPRLLHRRYPPLPRDRATGAAAARGLTPPSTTKTVCGASNITSTSQALFSVPLYRTNYTSTDQITTSLIRSIVVSLPLLPAWGFGVAPATQDIPTSIASSVVPVEILGRWPRRPAEDAGRRSLHYFPSGVRWPLCVVCLFQQNSLFVPGYDPKTCVSRNSILTKSS